MNNKENAKINSNCYTKYNSKNCNNTTINKNSSCPIICVINLLNLNPVFIKILI